MDADRGGTEILAPLREVLERPPLEGFARRVVLITDGFVSNEDEVIALARQHGGTARIFAFGVGGSASEHLVRGIARASGGAAEFVAPGERIDETVMRHFDRMTVGCLSDARLEFEGLEVERVTPNLLPALASGEELTVIAKVRAGTEGRVTLTGEGPAGPVRATAEIREESEGPPAAAAFLPTLWARRVIQELEDARNPATRRGSQQVDRTREKDREALVALALRYGLMSSETSFVVVEERAEGDKLVDRSELRRVPLAAELFVSRAGGADRLSRVEKFQSLDGGLNFLRLLPRSGGRSVRGGKKRTIGSRESLPRERQGSFGPTKTSFVERLIRTQNADGSWNLDPRVFDEAVDGFAAVKEVRSSLVSCALAATLAVVVQLEDRPGGIPPECEALVRKAEAWLSAKTADLAPPDPFPDWKSWARDLLARHRVEAPQK